MVHRGIPKKFLANATTTLIAKEGVLYSYQVLKDVDGGTMHFTDIDDAVITDFVPDATSKEPTDLAGNRSTSLADGSGWHVTNGLKVVVANAAGFIGRAWVGPS